MSWWESTKGFILLWGPIIFMADHQLNLSLLNPYLLGSLVAIALVLLTRSVLLSMLVSMLIFFLLRSWLA